MGQTLETLILINAKMGSGFSQIGSTLRNLGNMINQISQPLMEFGKESLNVYREYEMSLADAEVALSTTYGRNSAQLKRVMTDLDDAATEWAASTIFHTNDVGNALAEMAHAGWDYDQIMSGMPAAMMLAQAGALDLSEAVDYIVKSTNAAGIEFEGLGDFIDDWTFAANSSSTTIGEMGDAMLRMGRTMEFAGGQKELLTMLATLADAGTVGSDAGTLLRNTMLRLVAPTEKASDVMEELGFTAEEMESAMDDTTLVAAADALERVGFSAYDADTHKLKSMPQIFKDLSAAMKEIPDEDEQKAILSAIFPTRSITGAMALLEGAEDGWGGLLEQMREGASEGYAEYASERMMDTLNGSIEIFSSKVERLKQVVGGELAEDVRAFLTPMGEFVDSVAGMDEGSFGALVGALELIALAGPGLLIAGGAISYMSKFGGALGKLFGSLTGGSFAASLGSLAGWSALAAIALGALKKSMDEIYEADFESKFGEMSLDGSQLSAYASGIKEEFENANKQVTTLRTEFGNLLQDFTDKTNEMSGDMLTKAIVGKELTQDDKDKLYALGEQVVASLTEGIGKAHDAESLALSQDLLKADPNAAGTGVYEQIMDLINTDMETAIGEAEGLGQRLRDALTSGFADGKLTADEVSNIQSIFEEMDRIMAEQKDVEHAGQVAAAMYKAQTLGLDGIKEGSEILQGEMQSMLEDIARENGEEYAKLEMAYDKAIASGRKIREIDENGNVTDNMVTATAADKERALAAVKAAQDRKLYEYGAKFSQPLIDFWENGIEQSEMGAAFAELGRYSDMYRGAHGSISQTALSDYNEKVKENAGYISDYMEMWTDALGGIDKMQGYIDYFNSTGNADDAAMAARYQHIMDMYNVSHMSPESPGTYEAYGDYSGTKTLEDFKAYFDSTGVDLKLAANQIAAAYDQGMDPAQALSGLFGDPQDYVELNGIAAQFGATVESAISQLATAQQDTGGASIEAETTAGTKTQAPDIGPVPLEYELVGEPEVPDDLTVEANVAFNETEVPEVTEPVTITPKVEGIDAQEALTSQGVDVQVNGDTSSLTATIEAENGKELLEYVNGDASNLQASITAQDNRHITTYVSGNTASLAAAINAYNGRTITVNIVGRRLFASGGRATEASIFGEAGPEWAIPEEHSERTAQLLNAAREASGFSWPELLARFGGFNANPANTPATVVYSPTINAADVTGVDSALREDKSRLERWFRERQMLDGMEVYA